MKHSHSTPESETAAASVPESSVDARPFDPRWSWYYNVLLQLRDRLLDGRSEHLAEAAEPLEPHSLDLADSATDEFDHDRALSELSAEQDALYEINDALDRIARGTYGICEETGRPIPEERLKAIPWARRLTAVQSAIDRSDPDGRPHLGKLGSVRPELTGDMEESGVPSGDDLPVPAANDELLSKDTFLA